MNLKPSQIVLLVSGLLVVVFSFFAFNRYDPDREQRRLLEDSCENLGDVPSSRRASARSVCEGIDGWSAWTGIEVEIDDGFFSFKGGFAPLSIWPALLALVVAGATAATAFANVKLPDNVLSFTTKQLLGALSLIAFLIMFGILIGGAEGLYETGGSSPEDDEWLQLGFRWGIGFWLMLAGTAGLVVGSVMDLKDESSSPVGASPNQPPMPF